MWTFLIFFGAFCTIFCAQFIEANKICEIEPTAAPTQAPTSLWVDVVGGVIPEEAFVGGQDSGQDLILCRARHEGVLIPGKYAASYGTCFVGWGGNEHTKSEFEVYVGSGTWVAGAGSNIPPNAVLGVEPEDGGPVYVCRANHLGTVTIGKLNTQGVCYIPYGGQEHSYTDFEVLTS